MVVCDSYSDLYLCRLNENLHLVAVALYVIIGLTAVTVITVLLYTCGCVTLRLRHSSSSSGSASRYRLRKPSPGNKDRKPTGGKPSAAERSSSGGGVVDVERGNASDAHTSVISNPSAVNLAFTPDAGDLPVEKPKLPPETRQSPQPQPPQQANHHKHSSGGSGSGSTSNAVNLNPAARSSTGTGGLPSYRSGSAGPGSTTSSVASTSFSTSAPAAQPQANKPSSPTYQHPAKPGPSGVKFDRTGRQVQQQHSRTLPSNSAV